jgi:hypothetical protein
LFGKKRGMRVEEDEEESSEPDSDLEFEIQELYDLVKRNVSLLKGEEVQINEKQKDLE